MDHKIDKYRLKMIEKIKHFVYLQNILEFVSNHINFSK